MINFLLLGAAEEKKELHVNIYLIFKMKTHEQVINIFDF